MRPVPPFCLLLLCVGGCVCVCSEALRTPRRERKKAGFCNGRRVGRAGGVPAPRARLYLCVKDASNIAGSSQIRGSARVTKRTLNGPAPACLVFFAKALAETSNTTRRGGQHQGRRQDNSSIPSTRRWHPTEVTKAMLCAAAHQVLAPAATRPHAQPPPRSPPPLPSRASHPLPHVH